MTIAALAAGLTALALYSVEHGPHAPSRGHQHHAHTHSHDGHAHTHVHLHSNHEQHPDDGGDHHECASGHGDPAPIVLTTLTRDSRRVDASHFAGSHLAVPGMLTREAPCLAPPERPPRPPTSQDALSQLRTVVLLT